MMTLAKTGKSSLKPIAQAGLTAKGIVYCLLGVLTFMAACRINGTSERNTDKGGVFDFVLKQSGGQVMLAVIALGLFCYCVWRFIEAFADTEHKGKDAKGLSSRGRYLLSGLVYGSVAVQAVSMLLSGRKGSGDQKQDLAQELLNKPYGEWLAGIGAAILIGIGIYQIWYGLSEKYRKHVEGAGHAEYRDALLTAGKVGYVARGIVWLLIGWLFAKAALHSNAAEAGDTSKAFAFLHGASYGTYLLGAVGVGLVCYGVFSFVRARYERFG
jgi:hypothetical protein